MRHIENIQLLTTEVLDITWYPPENTNTRASIQWWISTSYPLQYLNSQQLFYYNDLSRPPPSAPPPPPPHTGLCNLNSQQLFGNDKIRHQESLIQKARVDVGVTTGYVTKLWYWLACTSLWPRKQSISQNMDWAESSSEPMKSCLFIDHTVDRPNSDQTQIRLILILFSNVQER